LCLGSYLNQLKKSGSCIQPCGRLLTIWEIAVMKRDRSMRKSRRLVKLALSIGAGLEGATHSAVRSARKAGIKQEEIDHVAVLAVSTLGLPSATRAFTWIRDKGK